MLGARVTSVGLAAARRAEAPGETPPFGGD